MKKNTNLVEAFDHDDNESEISKYGKQRKEKKQSKIVFSSLIILIIILSIIIYFIISKNKKLKNELRESRIKNKEIETNLENVKKELVKAIQKCSYLDDKNYELLIQNNYTIKYLNEKVQGLKEENNNLNKDLEEALEKCSHLINQNKELTNSYINNSFYLNTKINSLEEKNDEHIERNEILEEQNEDLSDQLLEEKEIKEELKEEIKKFKDYKKEIEEEYPFIKKDKENRNVYVIENGMSDDMKNNAISLAKEAMDRFENSNSISYYIKTEFDNKYNKSWHCFVGLDYSGYFTYEKNNYINFLIGQYDFLLYKI